MVSPMQLGSRSSPGELSSREYLGVELRIGSGLNFLYEDSSTSASADQSFSTILVGKSGLFYFFAGGYSTD